MTKPSKLDQPIVRHSPSSGADSPDVWGIYEPDTGSIQYICTDPATRKAALIDVVADFDPTSFATGTRSMDRVLDLVSENGLSVEWVLDTHPHADHMMASARLKQRTGAPNAIGEKVAEIAELWREIYNMSDAFPSARFRPAVRRWRAVRARRSGDAGDAIGGAYAGIDHLCLR